MKKILILICFLASIVSCKKTPDYNADDYPLGGGIFILNEGNFLGGNGSLSFYSYDSLKIYNDLFQSINSRPLGDVPFSMAIREDKGYIVVNNSGKIEVINSTTFESTATINNLISPRNIAFINSSKAYVSSLYSDSVAVIDLFNNSISGYINLRRTSEAIVVAGNNAYISNWAGGNEIMVINTLDNTVVDSIEVGIEPESMVIDRNTRLWVLCTGGWSGTEAAKLVQIDISTNSVLNTLTFPIDQSIPSSLTIDSYKQNLYFLDGGVKQMDIALDRLPNIPIIAETGATFYKLAVNPSNGDIFVTDAVDYAQKGYVMIYKNDGTFISKERADIIPGSMCFKLRL
jgi:DNA-binding beta-propeller fold protein YncE